MLAPLRRARRSRPTSRGPSYPAGASTGPARLLLRYPVRVTRSASRGAREEPGAADGGRAALASARPGGTALAPGQDARDPCRARRSILPAIEAAPLLLLGQPRPAHPDRRLGRLSSSRVRATRALGARKVEVGERLEALAYTIEADFQILRVARRFDAAAYVRRALATLDPRHGHRDALRSATSPSTAPAFEAREALRPEIYLAVRLDAAGGPARSAALSRAPRRCGARSPRASATRSRAASAPAALRPCAAPRRRPTSGCSATWSARGSAPQRLATLIRRAYTRGLGEPDTDEGFAPQALQLPRPRAARSASSPTATTSCACTRAASPSAAARS